MTRAANPVATTRGLRVGYEGIVAGVVPDLDISDGIVWHVAGPNGSGKTALLKTLAGLIPPVAGHVERRCGMGPRGAIYVHSSPFIFAGTTERNLALAGPGREEAHTMAQAFGLTHLLDRRAGALSHGEQRRLALARALLARPAILLVDEPEGGLDEDALAAWRACAGRAVQLRETVLVVAAHRPLALPDVPVRIVDLDGRRRG